MACVSTGERTIPARSWGFSSPISPSLSPEKTSPQRCGRKSRSFFERARDQGPLWPERPSPLQLQPQHESIRVIIRMRHSGGVLLPADAGAQHDVARDVVVDFERQIDGCVALRDADELVVFV